MQTVTWILIVASIAFTLIANQIEGRELRMRYRIAAIVAGFAGSLVAVVGLLAFYGVKLP